MYVWRRWEDRRKGGEIQVKITRRSGVLSRVSFPRSLSLLKVYNWPFP